MRVWMFQIGQRFDASRSIESTYTDRIDEALLAEELGFHGLWAAEHHFTNYAAFPNPQLYLAALARITTRLRLGTMAVVLPMHNPVRVAEETAMLDQLSGGRAELGLARGYTRFEYESLGASWERSQALMKEGIEVIQQLFTQEDAGHDGENFSFAPLTMVPAPFENRRPPMWYACGSENSIDLALDAGMDVAQSLGLKPIEVVRSFSAALQEKIAARGIDPSTVRYGLQVPVHVVTSEDGRVRGAEQIRWMYRLAGSFAGTAQRKTGGFVTETGDVPGTDGDPFTITSSNLIGDVEHVRAMLDTYRELGVTDLSLNFEFGDITAEERRASMRSISEILELAPTPDVVAVGR